MIAILFWAWSSIAVAASALGSQTDTRSLASSDTSVYASMELFAVGKLMGFSAKIPIRKPNVCYDITCFDQKAASVAWELPADTILGLFSEGKCRGDYEWFHIGDKGTSATSLKRGISYSVSSVLVVDFGAGPIQYVQGCPNGTEVTGAFRPYVVANEPA